jgi:hypothetical protein
MNRSITRRVIMAMAANDIERIVRKVLNEEQDETVGALRELTTLLTEEVIPKLSKMDGDEIGEGDDIDSGDEVDPDEEADSDEGGSMTMSGFDDDDATSFGQRTKPNGHGGDEEDETPEEELPRAAVDAFTALYHALTSEQASALAEFFTVIDSELDDEGRGNEESKEDGRRAQA